jgi:hypothetical protein
MPIKLLLNFPKIKKSLDSDVKLREILEEFLNSTKPEDVHFSLKYEDDVVYIKKKVK